MFADAIEKVGAYTRPLVYIRRNYGETIVRSGSSTIFFVNEYGCAVTSRRVAEIILALHNVNMKYARFKKAKSLLADGEDKARQLRRLEAEYGYGKDIPVNMKCDFKGCVSPVGEIAFRVHRIFDLAVVCFKGFGKKLYDGFAVFADKADSLRPGDRCCRIGFPFPEFSNFIYNGITDDIELNDIEKINIPRFPTEGMVTRHLAREGRICGIEVSNPGTLGQRGGPLFDASGTVYGMQYETCRLDLGLRFAENGLPLREDVPGGTRAFMYVSHCISAEVIKTFLRENGVKYYTESAPEGVGEQKFS